MVADAEALRAGGVPPEQWPERIGATAEAIRRALYRAGRTDLARPISALVSKQRREHTDAKRCPGCGGPVSADPRRRWCSGRCWDDSDEGRAAKAEAGRARAAQLGSTFTFGRGRARDPTTDHRQNDDSTNETPRK